MPIDTDVREVPAKRLPKPELKPCPCCGSNATWVKQGSWPTQVRAVCTGCGMSSVLDVNERVVAFRWNRRATRDAQAKAESGGTRKFRATDASALEQAADSLLHADGIAWKKGFTAGDALVRHIAQARLQIGHVIQSMGETAAAKAEGAVIRDFRITEMAAFEKAAKVAQNMRPGIRAHNGPDAFRAMEDDIVQNAMADDIASAIRSLKGGGQTKGNQPQTSAPQGFEGGGQGQRKSPECDMDVAAAKAEGRREALEEALAHIAYVRENIVPNPKNRQRFDHSDLTQAFRAALTIAKERITGEDEGKWLPDPDALRTEEEA